jgi:hypothetical protein
VTVGVLEADWPSARGTICATVGTTSTKTHRTRRMRVIKVSFLLWMQKKIA